MAIGLLLMAVALQSCYVDNVDLSQDARAENDRQIQDYIRNNNLTATGSGSGLYYVITRATTGKVAKTGDSVIVHFTTRLLGERMTIVDSTSRFLNRPDNYWLFSNVRIRPSISAGLEEVLKILKEGEKAQVFIPSYLAFGANGTSVIPPYSVLVYDIEILDVIDEEERLAKYIAKKNITLDATTDSGLKYKRISLGTPNYAPQNGEDVVVNYVLEFAEGTVFQTSSDSSFVFPLVAKKLSEGGSVIDGFAEGVRLTNYNGKTLLLMPSKLAYGENGSFRNNTYDILPYTPLIYEIVPLRSQKTRMLDYIKANAWTDTVRTTFGIDYFYSRIETAAPAANAQATATDSVQVRIVNAQYLTYESNLSTPFFSQEIINFRLNKSEADTNNKELIIGLRQGLILMKEGEIRRIIIPSQLAFGNKGKAGKPVPGKSPVVYVVELMRIIK